MEITIRRAKPQDIPRINELFVEMLRTIHQTDHAEGYAAGALDYYFESNRNIIFLAEADRQTIGFLSVEEHEENDRHYAYIDDFSVTAQYRSLGVGSRLIERAESFARERSCPVVCLNAETYNLRALRFSERRGYRIFDTCGQRATLIKPV